MNNSPLCYVAIPGAKVGKRIGIIKREESGYYLTDLDNSLVSDPVALVDILNKRLGVSKEEAEAMEAGSMFGWQCLAARRA